MQVIRKIYLKENLVVFKTFSSLVMISVHINAG